MPATACNTSVDLSRKRKPHKKSRKGCRNCKIRRVKCDETTPKCKRCIDFGASCNYDSSKRTGDLDMSFDGVTISTVHEPPLPSNQVIISNDHIPDFLYPERNLLKDSVLQLDKASRDRLARFQTRTVLSVGTVRAARLFQSTLLPMALSRPYLMHAVQTLTAIEDRYYSDKPGRRSIAEIYHITHAAAQFNRELSVPLKDSERDAIWTTAILLGLSAFAQTDASTPAESWPLKPSDPSDLEWLRMSDMKSAIYKLTNPLREGSMFYPLKEEYLTKYGEPIPDTGTAGIPGAFADLCGLDASSTVDSSPYFRSMHVLARLLRQRCTRANFTSYLQYIMHMGPEYKRLLQVKDPRALLMLSYWYATVADCMWWMANRAVLEGQATCMYLEEYHPDETKLQSMLYYPKMRCGLLTTTK